MGITYLWDTNIVIYYLQQQFPSSAEKFMDQILESAIPSLSAIVEIELLCWKPEREEDLEVVRNFISDTRVFELEQNIKLKTAEIRKKHKINLPDAIIAATALDYNLTLLTRNVNDFKDIKGLNYVNPFDQ